MNLNKGFAFPCLKKYTLLEVFGIIYVPLLSVMCVVILLETRK